MNGNHLALQISSLLSARRYHLRGEHLWRRRQCWPARHLQWCPPWHPRM